MNLPGACLLLILQNIDIHCRFVKKLLYAYSNPLHHKSICSVRKKLVVAETILEDYESVSVLAHSMGGAIALYYSKFHKDGFDKVIGWFSTSYFFAVYLLAK